MNKFIVEIILIIFLACSSYTSFAQKKTIALLEPRVGNGSTEVNAMEKAMLRGELRKAIAAFEDFEAITRTDIDKMMEEFDFQSSGMVDDEQRKRIGQMSGADYICVSTLTKSNVEFYLETYLIDMTSGKIINPASQYGILENGRLTNLLSTCQTLSKELLGKNKPILHVETTSYNFGKISSSGGEVASIPLKNVGGGTLHITKVNYHGAYSIEYPSKLEAGDIGTLVIRVLKYNCEYKGQRCDLPRSIEIQSDGGNCQIRIYGYQQCP